MNVVERMEGGSKMAQTTLGDQEKGETYKQDQQASEYNFD